MNEDDTIVVGIPQTRLIPPARPPEFKTDAEWAHSLWNRVCELENQMKEDMAALQGVARIMSVWTAITKRYER